MGKYRVVNSNIKHNGKIHKIGSEIELDNVPENLSPFLKAKEKELQEKEEFIKKLLAEIDELKAKSSKEEKVEVAEEKPEEKVEVPEKPSKKGGKN